MIVIIAGTITKAVAISWDLQLGEIRINPRQIFCKGKVYKDLTKFCRLKLKTRKPDNGFGTLYFCVKRKYQQQQ